MTDPRRLSIAFLRDLLRDYLTEPPYATVTPIDSNGLLVELPDGGGKFVVTVREAATEALAKTREGCAP